MPAVTDCELVQPLPVSTVSVPLEQSYDPLTLQLHVQPAVEPTEGLLSSVLDAHPDAHPASSMVTGTQPDGTAGMHPASSVVQV